MNTQQLRYFLSVTKYRNFTKAAAHLYIGQPALSRQISELEQELGVKLFFRNNRSVTLTAAGEILQEEGTKLIKYYNHVVERTKRAAEGVTGYLRIATLGYFDRSMQQMIHNFTLKYPNVKLDLNHLEISQLNDAVMSENCDLGVSYKFAISDLEECDYEVLSREKFFIIASKNTSISKKQTLSCTDLLNEKIILPSGPAPGFCNMLFNTNTRAGEKENTTRITYTDSEVSLLLQVEAGIGIAIVPGFVATNLTDKNYFHILEIDGINTMQYVVMFWKKNNQNPICNNFKNFMKEYIQNNKEGSKACLED